jgi:hypothetical protein
MIKNSRWLLSLLLVAAITAVAVFPVTHQANAQDGQGCTLAPEDCALLEAAVGELGSLNSVNLKSFSLAIAGGAGDQQSSLTAEGFGPIVFEDENGLLAADLTLTNYNLTTAEGTQSGSRSLRIVDSWLFVGQGEGDAVAWQGTELDTSEIEVFGANLSDIRDFPVAEALVALNNLPGVVAWSRGEDVTLEDGTTVAVFTFDISLANLVASEEFVNALSEILLPLISELGGEMGGDLLSDPATVSFVISLLLSQISDQLSTSTSQFSLWVSPDDNQIYGTAATIDVTVDLSFLSDFLPNSTSGTATAPAPINFALDFQSVLDQHNGEFVIEAPADYEPLDTSALEDFDLSSVLENIGLGGGDDSAAPAVPTVETAEFDIVVGEEATGTLNSANETDLYRLQASEGDVITITMQKSNDTSNLDPYLKLYDATGALLAENDDAENVSEELGFLDSQIFEFEVPADGVYLIEASALFIPDDGEYTLLVEIN